MSLESNIKAAIRDVPDFPKPGIMFKDITPILENQTLCNEIVDGFIANLSVKPDAIAGIESRGFLFGFLLIISCSKDNIYDFDSYLVINQSEINLPNNQKIKLKFLNSVNDYLAASNGGIFLCLNINSCDILEFSSKI